jgi:hypothetical protein
LFSCFLEFIRRVVAFIMKYASHNKRRIVKTLPKSTLCSIITWIGVRIQDMYTIDNSETCNAYSIRCCFKMEVISIFKCYFSFQSINQNTI